MAGFELYDPALGGSASSVTTRSGVSLSLPAVPSGVLPLPTGMTVDSLQAFTGPASFQIIDHPTHGILNCYLDGDLKSQCSFEDGEGHICYRTATGSFLLYDEDSSTETTGSTGPGISNIRRIVQVRN